MLRKQVRTRKGNHPFHDREKLKNIVAAYYAERCSGKNPYIL